MPGVVYAIACAIRAFTGPGDAVIIQQPVYYPFYETIVDNHRKCINSQLIYEDGRYRMDYEDFEQKIIENQVRLFLLCNPHNPVGRVWTREELQRIGEICIRHNVIIFADEIHGDFTYPGYHYTPFASISEEFARHTVVGTSPSKTFNLAGLQAANIVVLDETLRRQLRQENAAAGYSQANTLGLVACQSAYEKGEEWHAQLLRYLTGNLAYVRDFLRERIPQIQLVEPEGTYLVWLDCRKLADNHKDLEHLIVEEAKLWLDPGAIFGRETKLFERINIACPRATLEQALQQLEAAVQARLSQ